MTLEDCLSLKYCPRVSFFFSFFLLFHGAQGRLWEMAEFSGSAANSVAAARPAARPARLHLLPLN